MKKLLAFLLCYALVFGSLSFPVMAAETDITDTSGNIGITGTAADAAIDASGATADEIAPSGYSLISESEFQSKLSALRSKYTNGSIWEGVYYEGGYARAWECFAYAAQMMYEVFGARYYGEQLYKLADYDRSEASINSIRAGDIVRINGDGHSIFIIKVTDSGFYYTDGNGTGIYNQVRWDGYYSKSQMLSIFTYKVHLSGNNLTGVGATHTIAYNANGGSGNMSSVTLQAGEGFTIKENEFSRPGFTFAGYIVKRSIDNTWFTSGGNKWQPESEIYDNGYRYSLYYPGEPYKMSTNWLGSYTSSTTFTFYAQWLPDSSTVEYYSNYSGYNYILGSDLSGDYDDYIFSRNTSVYSVTVDASEQLNNANSLKITGKSAGASGGGASSDLAILTSTNKGYADGYSQAGTAGDDKDLYLHFYAKASVDGAKMYIRWGYNSSGACKSVTLSTKWQVYTITMPKNRSLGSALHSYFDKAGTYYLNSLALGDYSFTSNVVPETGTRETLAQSVTRGEKLKSMPEPARGGYTFLGWYTAAEGGERVTTDTPINESTIRLYAHWRKNISEAPVKTVIENGHVYELYDNTMGWEEASRFCAAKGGHLISIGSDAENRMAYDMISDRQGYCWIGLHYLTGSKIWDWVDETDPASYTGWFDDSYGKKDSGEYYALLYPMNVGTRTYAGTWDKCKGSGYYCSYYGYLNSFFICEYDEPVFLGDADGNGAVESLDATLIQRYRASIATSVPEEILQRGDVDADGCLEIMDATFIQRHLANMQTPYEVAGWIKS